MLLDGDVVRQPFSSQSSASEGERQVMANLERLDEPLSVHANQVLRVLAGLDRRDRAHRTRRALRPAARRLRVTEDGEDHELGVDRRVVSVDVDQLAVGGVVAPPPRRVRLHHMHSETGPH
jgi:hypothetical protein